MNTPPLPRGLIVDDDVLYARMLQRGRERAKDFTFEATAAKWERLFRGPIAERHALWRRRRGGLWTLRRRAWWATAIVQNRVERRRFARWVSQQG